MSSTIKSGTDVSMQYRNIWPDGSIHWAEIRAQLYRHRSGKAVKMVGVAADITERRQSEESQRQLSEGLEVRVAVRTAELEAAHANTMAEVAQRERAEEQLRQAQKMEAIGQLTGGVAHDFNNLLMAVLGNLELLHKHVGLDAKALRLIDGAIQGAKRGASLTQRLLAFARKQDLQVAPVALDKLVAGMEDLLRRSVGSAITIETAIPDGLPPALADTNQLELALLNLVVNARDAMPGGGYVRVGLRRVDVRVASEDLAEGGYVVLSVADTGQGMDEATLKKAIDPFFSTKELGKGTGLGLSMIHGLALQLRGTLRLESTLGEGTIAELWIPAASKIAEIAGEAVPYQQPVPAVVEPGEDASLRILMVDDDVLIAMSSVDMLEDLGHEVTEANSGEDALRILEGGERFDLMITDYSMPRMTGAELAKAARRLRPGIPILLATGYAELPAGMEFDIQRLSKPYSQKQLSAEIAKALKTGQAVGLPGS